MEDTLLNKEIGSEGKMDLVLENGKLKFTVTYDSKGLDASLGIALEPGYFLGKLAAAIPGGIDDAVINILKAALKV